jgi:hypothetical protein
MEVLQEIAAIALQASVLLIVLAIGLDATFDDVSFLSPILFPGRPEEGAPCA